MPKVLFLKQQNLNGSPPDAIQVVPLGEYKDGFGRPFRVTEDDVAIILENANKRANPFVMDYEHQTLGGKEAPAAGWMNSLVNKGKDGLWAAIEWTDRAKEYLSNKEYRFLSPVLLANKKDKDGFFRPSIFHSAGLTNDPQIDGMEPLINKLSIEDQNDQNKMEVISMKRLFELLGLKADATEDAAVEALTLLKNKAENPEIKEVIPNDLLSALDLKEGSNTSEVKATILALKQNSNVVSVEEFQAMKTEMAEKKRDDLVALAMKQGKITAAQNDWAMDYALADPEGFEVFINKATAVVPMKKLDNGGNEENTTVLTDEALLVAKAMGNTKEDLVKYGGIDKGA